MTEFDPKTFAWWKAALAGKEVPMHLKEAHQGYYAYRPSEKAVPLPVALWYDKGTGLLRCKIGDAIAPKPGIEYWPMVMRNPITFAIYESVMKGEPWPNEIRFETADGGTQSSMIGHNSGDDDETLFGNIAEWKQRLAKAMKTPIKTQEDADALADIATKLRELKDEADKRRKETTKPLRDEVDSINDRYNKHIEPAAFVVSSALASVKKWVREEKDRQAAALKAAKAAAKSAGVEMPEVQAANVSAGTRKKVVTFFKDVAVIEDWPKVMASIAALDAIPNDVQTVITAAAERLLKAGVKVPGAKLEKKEFGR